MDPYCRSHRWRNLFILDGSVFPSSGSGESPSLTIGGEFFVRRTVCAMCFAHLCSVVRKACSIAVAIVRDSSNNSFEGHFSIFPDLLLLTT